MIKRIYYNSMVVGSKSEERIKELLKEYLYERRENLDRDISNATSGIFLWGFLCGIVVAYTSLWPFIIGVTVGYYATRRDLPIIDKIYGIGNKTIVNGYQLILNYIGNK